MPKEHLPVRKIREVLRLKSEGFSNRAIARVCQVSNSTVGEYLEKAKQAGLSWPLPEGMSEETLYPPPLPNQLFPLTMISLQLFKQNESGFPGQVLVNQG